jgi:desulfoferrodoxin (superoxide reductase-like protein)
MGKFRFSFLCALFLLTVALAVASEAHPPRGVTLVMNSDGSLTVRVEHSVNDPQKHYVNKIAIYVNDKLLSQKEYSSQTNAEDQADTFQIGSQPPGTKITAEAFCVIMGSASGSITVK